MLNTTHVRVVHANIPFDFLPGYSFHQGFMPWHAILSSRRQSREMVGNFFPWIEIKKNTYMRETMDKYIRIALSRLNRGVKQKIEAACGWVSRDVSL